MITERVQAAHDLLTSVIDQVTAEGKEVAGIVLAFSGGNDSTTLAHLFRHRATHAAHANTGIGIEQTRQYVRDTCASWGLPLIEKGPPPGETYRDLVLGRCLIASGPNAGKPSYAGGFPGPAMHYLMYQRLKERAFRQVRRELVTRPRRQRLIVLAGRRAQESSRRSARALGDADGKQILPVEREGSVIWASPLLEWSALDINAYRRAYPDVPRNEVSDLLHMSGECLCGAFAGPGELDEIAEWFPDAAAAIRQLEKEVGAAELPVPAERCRWGWGAYRERPSQSGRMCSSCEGRYEQMALWG